MVSLGFNLVHMAFDWFSMAPGDIHIHGIIDPSPNISSSEAAKIFLAMLLHETGYLGVSKPSQASSFVQILPGRKTSVRSGRCWTVHPQVQKDMRIFSHAWHFSDDPLNMH